MNREQYESLPERDTRQWRKEVLMKAFDIEFYAGTKDRLIEDLVEHSTDKYSYIVTPNVNHVVQLETDRDLKRAYAVARHRICDSRVLLPLLAARSERMYEYLDAMRITGESPWIELWERGVGTVWKSDAQWIRENEPHWRGALLAA